MGDQYLKINGVWTLAQRPYAKIGGVWNPAQQTYVKQSGAWVNTWTMDTTPPAPPETSLSIESSGYIAVRARVGTSSHDATLRRIRVLVGETPPTTQFGGGYISTPVAPNYPGEDWSDWWYNNQNPTHLTNHGPSNNFTYKNYPGNANSATNLPDARWYYVTAWSEDINGNWSVGSNNSIYMPKDGVAARSILSKEKHVQANASGLAYYTGGAYFSGQPVTNQGPPATYGLVFYGDQIVDSIGANGTPTIKSATIRLSRAYDAGQPVANVRVGWISQGTPGPWNAAAIHDPQVIGTLQKGEAKWFNLPSTWIADANAWNTAIRGVSFKPSTAAADYIIYNDIGTDARMGEIAVQWEEAI